MIANGGKRFVLGGADDSAGGIKGGKVWGDIMNENLACFCHGSCESCWGS